MSNYYAFGEDTAAYHFKGASSFSPGIFRGYHKPWKGVNPDMKGINFP